MMRACAVRAMLLLAAGAGIASADQLVITREMHTSPDMPLGGSVRVVQRVDGPRVREETTMTMKSPAPDSLVQGEPTRRDSSGMKEEATAVWFPAERIWRTWSAGQNEFDEMSAADVLRLSVESAASGLGLLQILGGGPRESFAQDVAVDVDSSGAASTIAGVGVRPYRVRGTVRLYELEADRGDSLRFEREVWMAPTLAGATEAVAQLRQSPAQAMEGTLRAVALLPLAALGGALRGVDEAVARIGGYVMRDEVRIESAAALPMPGAATDSTRSLVLLHSEVLDVRREPSRPELFRVPAGLHKRAAPSASDVRVTPVPVAPAPAPRGSGAHR